MIFFSKRNNAPGQSSSTETCVSILGLFVVIGLVGGLAALIYGLVKGHSSGIIGGGVILGVSVLFSIILALIFVYCLKNNNVNSNTADQRSSTNPRQYKQNRHHKQNRQVKHEHTSSHEITIISGVQKYDNNSQQQSNGYNVKVFTPPVQTGGLSDSTNFGFGKQLPQSPSKTSTFNLLNQSNGSMNNQSFINTNSTQKNSNRH